MPEIFIQSNVQAIHATLIYEQEVARATLKGAQMTRFIDATWEKIQLDFGKYLDTKARHNKIDLHHVYEWGGIGVPQARLWKLVRKRHSNGMTISYQFKQSKRVTPINPKLQVVGATGKSVKRSQVFRRKAWVLELGLPVVINRKNANMLAIPSYNNFLNRKGKRAFIHFKEGPIHAKQAIVPDNLFAPGATVGQFRSSFNMWFRGNLARKSIEPMLEKPGKIMKVAGESLPNEVRNVKMGVSISDTVVIAEARAMVERLANAYYGTRL